MVRVGTGNTLRTVSNLAGGAVHDGQHFNPVLLGELSVLVGLFEVLGVIDMTMEGALSEDRRQGKIYADHGGAGLLSLAEHLRLGRVRSRGIQNGVHADYPSLGAGS